MISRLRMAIVTMYQSVCREAVRLPGDRSNRLTNTSTRTVDEMMDQIKNHIGDLEMVNRRVHESEEAGGYNRGLNSQNEDF